MTMEKQKNILLISGSGRNCGKTTMACHAIRQLSAEGKVYGLKITSHFHLTTQKQELVCEGKGFKIYKESDLHSGKDTSRMLLAGATDVFCIHCTDANLHKAAKCIEQLIGIENAVVCESGSLANVYSPGLHLLIKGKRVDETKASYLANLDKVQLVFTQKDFSPTDLPFQFNFSEGKWTINKKKHDQHRRSA